jgi:hypothetical protein
MGLKERIKEKSAGLVRRETITLPETGEEVQVRGLMFGEKERAAELKGAKQSFTLIALVVEDPATGAPIWNANSQEDHDEIAGLHIADTDAIVEAMNRLSSGKEKAAPPAPAPLPLPSSDSESEDAPSPSLRSA